MSRMIAISIRASSAFKCGDCRHVEPGHDRSSCRLFNSTLNYVPKNELTRNYLYDHYRCRKCVKAEAMMQKGKE